MIFLHNYSSCPAAHLPWLQLTLRFSNAIDPLFLHAQICQWLLTFASAWVLPLNMSSVILHSPLKFLQLNHESRILFSVGPKLMQSLECNWGGRIINMSFCPNIKYHGKTKEEAVLKDWRRETQGECLWRESPRIGMQELMLGTDMEGCCWWYCGYYCYIENTFPDVQPKEK